MVTKIGEKNKILNVLVIFKFITNKISHKISYTKIKIC